MMKRTLLTLATLAALTSAQACGPDFFPDVFVRTDRPDLPGQYVRGHLGMLHRDFPSADLFVAYRYLNGGTLTGLEQAGWTPTYSVAEEDYGKVPQQAQEGDGSPNHAALAAWVTARSRFVSTDAGTVDPYREQTGTTPSGASYNQTFVNCGDDAFRTAATTVQARAATWGTTSPYLADWIRAQDAVFSNCSGKAAVMPQAAPAGSPALLQQDRAYQIAAAQFYAGNLAEAVRQFDAIAADAASPWRTVAGYVAGRALLREAFLNPTNPDSPEDYDKAGLAAALHHVNAFLATRPPQPWERAAGLQRNLIRIRLEPQVRTRELAAALAGPGEDANYKQDVQDVLWVFRNQVPDAFRATPSLYDDSVKGPDGEPRVLTPAEALQRAEAKRETGFAATAALRSVAPVLDWTLTIRSLAPSSAAHALAMWQQTQSQAWLVAALMLAPDRGTSDAALLKAAEAVPAASPAYQTVAWHRARLLLAAGDAEAARSTLAGLRATLDSQPVALREPSTANAIQDMESRSAMDASGWIAHLPQTVLLAASEAASNSRDCAEAMTHKGDWHHCLTPGPQDLDASAAHILNQQAPLALWVDAARSQNVPQPLREAIAMQGWTRATLLQDATAAAAFQPLLPAPLQQQLAGSSPLTPLVALARNPGLTPYVEGGVQRAYSYDFVENYRDNWCYNPADATGPEPAVAAVTAQQRTQGAAEAAALKPLRSVVVGQKILAAVAANPQDAQAPEALYLVLRMIRYGCNAVREPGTPLEGSLSDQSPDARTGAQLLTVRRATAALMRRYYASSTWTKKAAPFVGEVRPPRG